MMGPSTFIRGIPRLLYFAAAFWILWNVFLALSQLSVSAPLADQHGSSLTYKFALAEFIVRSALDSVFLVGSAASVQILLYIYDAVVRGAKQ